MLIVCSCGEDMEISRFEPDQDEVYIEGKCPVCGALFGGIFRQGEEGEGGKIDLTNPII